MNSAGAFVLDPRLAADTHFIVELGLARVLLMDDARFPWLILVPRKSELREILDLPRADQHALLDEIAACAQALRSLTQPDKLNIAALGNVVAQLHVHIVARHAQDAAWPRPVWGVGERERYGDVALTGRLLVLRSALSPKAGA